MHSEHLVLVKGSRLCVNGLTEMTDPTQVEAFGSLKCKPDDFRAVRVDKVLRIAQHSLTSP